jgi:hypothetical protein
MSRALRDHLEHFEERLDQWSHESKRHGRVDRNIGPSSFVGGGVVDGGDQLRGYDPGRQVYTFGGEEFSIRELLQGVQEVGEAVRARMKHLDASAG